MIYDRFSRLPLYEEAVPYLTEIYGQLSQKDLLFLEPGTYYTKDNGIKYMVQSYETAEKKQPELHGRYADVQIMVGGTEKFGFDVIAERPEAFNEADDIGFLEGECRNHLILSSMDAVIVLPGEPHTPGLADGKPEQVRKIVVKIPVA